MAEAAHTLHSNTTRPRPLAAPLHAACVVLNIKQRTIFWSACKTVRYRRKRSSRSLSHLLMSSCTNRVANTWNSLPNWVVSANTTNTFKTRLDKFWHNQDVIIIISGHSCMEPEVVASFCMKNLSKDNIVKQGRNHRGRHGGRVPRAPYHVPLHQSDNSSLSSELTFDEWRGVITAYN